MLNMEHHLGTFLMPHFLDWRREVYHEQALLFKTIAAVRKKRRAIDQCLGRLRKGNDLKDFCRRTAERKSVDDKLKGLEYELELCRRTYDKIERVFKAATQQYAETCCLELTRTIYTKLPRELRDEIYIQLLHTEPLDLVCFQTLHAGVAEGSECCKEKPCMVPRFHFLSERYMYKEMSNELLYIAAVMHAMKAENFKAIADKKRRPGWKKISVVGSSWDIVSLDPSKFMIPIHHWFNELRVEFHIPKFIKAYGLSGPPYDESTPTVVHLKSQIGASILALAKRRDCRTLISINGIQKLKDEDRPQFIIQEISTVVERLRENGAHNVSHYVAEYHGYGVNDKLPMFVQAHSDRQYRWDGLISKTELQALEKNVSEPCENKPHGK